MEEKFYMLFAEFENIRTIKYATKEMAEKEAELLANKINKKVYVLEKCVAKIPEEVNKLIDSYRKALKYQGLEDDFKCSGGTEKNNKAMIAMYKLIIIAEAWNKADNFIPDFDYENQRKWFPWFRKKGDGGFTCTCSSSNSSFVARFCFKTEERAKQFSKQFIDLWNDFLL